VSVGTRSSSRPAATAAAAAVAPSLARVRRGSLAALVLVVLEFGIGMYLNLYLSVPQGDRGRAVGSAIASGPAVLSVHAVVGLALGLVALGVLAAAALARHAGAIAASAAGLFALAFASVAGTGFSSSGQTADSMAMSVMTGVALLCYAANVYWVRHPGRR
jgi:hypothetical protein